MNTLIEGTYAHRFNGNTLDRNYTVHYLAGLGTLTLARKGDIYTVKGQQDAVAVAFAQVAPSPAPDNTPQQVKNRRFSLDGDIEWSSERGLWVAKVTFTQIVSPPAQPIVMDGSYVMSETGNDGHYWFMSIGQIIKNGMVIAAEGASGEARLISRKTR